MPDSILHNIDSTSLMNPDTLQMKDSLLQLDSLVVVDSLKSVIVTPPTGMDGILHPSSPGVESWVFVVIGVLTFFLVTGIIQSAGMFVQNFKSFFSRKDPVNPIINPTANIVQFQLFITVFTVCVFALLTYEMTFDASDKFILSKFGIFCAIFVGFYMLKHVLFEIVGNTFFNSRTTKNYKSMYFSMLNLLAVFLFPILILYTYQPENWQYPLEIATLILIGIFYIVLIIKLFQIFYVKPLALFYIFLYLCTLEILPNLILIRICEKFT